ncbi:hypothetical protein UFVDC4_00214 [Staphylococcus phage vB_SauM-UFV_DC4]|nr:hypothetical protein UFVDC4_00214 [Staphylococcus phage vB_SauM-UFV_DC4]BDE75792.1 hypothetical protein [Staphylococcus phage S6]
MNKYFKFKLNNKSDYDVFKFSGNEEEISDSKIIESYFDYMFNYYINEAIPDSSMINIAVFTEGKRKRLLRFTIDKPPIYIKEPVSTLFMNENDEDKQINFKEFNEIKKFIHEKIMELNKGEFYIYIDYNFDYSYRIDYDDVFDKILFNKNNLNLYSSFIKETDENEYKNYLVRENFK